jgi:type I restriction enzyme S subunit
MRKIKDSGVAWIGVIPENWQLLSVGALFKVRNEKVNDTDYPPLSVTKGGIVPQMESVAKSDATDNRKMVLKNDFVINSRSDRKQSCGVSPLDGSVSLINTVLHPVPNAPVLPDYLDYLLKNYGFAEEFYRWGHGIVADLWTTRWQEMKNIFLPIPPVEEQQKIIFSISTQMEKVDALIANVQEQIEKLKAYKQSLITEVVTKGLDPNVPMKDSGVEWIGEIANTRSVYRLKYLLSTPLQYGANESGGKYINDSVRYIRITDICADGSLKNDENNQYLSEKVASDYVLNDGDVLLARSGGTVGKSFLYHAEYGASAFAGYLIKADCNRDKLLPEFLVYYTQSSLYDIWKNMIFVQATIQNIGANKYSNLEIPIPPVDEQRTLVKELKVRCSKIDSLIHIKQQKIEKLEQYKRSLIYEYVTGKKEVS